MVLTQRGWKWTGGGRTDETFTGKRAAQTVNSTNDCPHSLKHRHWRSGDGWEGKQRRADISARRSCSERGWTDRLRETGRAGWFVTHDWLGTELPWKRQQNQSDECLVEAGCQSKGMLFLNVSLSVRTIVFCFCVFLMEICHKLGFVDTFCKQWSGCFATRLMMKEVNVPPRDIGTLHSGWNIFLSMGQRRRWWGQTMGRFSIFKPKRTLCYSTVLQYYSIAACGFTNFYNWTFD